MAVDHFNDAYVAATLEHFEAFVLAAIRDWPGDEGGPTPADFSPARFEILRVLDKIRQGNKTADADMLAAQPAAADRSVFPAEESQQYLPMTPAPWP